MGEVVRFNGTTRLDISPEQVLGEAISAGLDEAMVLGWDAHGDMYFASSKADGGEILWLLEMAKKRLLDLTDVD